MDALQLKVDSIRGEVGDISNVLRDYLEHGIVSGRKLMPPKTKAGRELLQQLLGRLDQVSTGLGHVAPSSPAPPPAIQGSATPSPYTPTTGLITTTQQQTNQTPPSSAPAVQSQESQVGAASRDPPTLSPQVTAGAESKPEPAGPTTGEASPTASSPGSFAVPVQHSPYITLSNGSVYHNPVLSEHAAPLFDCTYQDIHVLNEELFELYSSHPVVRDRGYFKLQVRDLPPLNVQKVGRPSKDHATSFSYKADRLGVIKVDTGKRFKFASPNLPLPMSAKTVWSFEEQRWLWNSSAADPPKGSRPYIIGNPLFHDVELSPGEKLRRRGRATLEGINTQYVYFNLEGKTITTMHREDAHVRSENLLRSGQHKFWCFVKPASFNRLEERMAAEYPEMRRCSQAVRHLSRHIPPAKLDEWGVEYTLDYCVPGQAVVTEPGTYHQVLNLGPNYAIAINLEYNSSPDMPVDYRFCDKQCPDKYAMSADDFRIYDKPPQQQLEDSAPRTPETTGSRDDHAAVSGPVVPLQLDAVASQKATQPATPPPEQGAPVASQPLWSGAQLPGKASPQGQQQQQKHSASVVRVEEVKNTPQQQLLQPPAMVTPIPILRGGISTEPVPATRPNLPPSQPNKVEEVPKPLEPHHTPVGSSSLGPFASQVAGAPTEPVLKQDGQLLPQVQNLSAGAIARSMQVLPQGHNILPQELGHRTYVQSRMEPMPPIRKTARMINPDRESDPEAARPLKKQKVESPSASPAQEVAAKGPFHHLATMLRKREGSEPGNLVAEKLRGKPAFERLSVLVSEWRRFTKSMPKVPGGFELIRSAEQTLHGYPELQTFLGRFFRLKVAMYMEPKMTSPGQWQPRDISHVLQMLGWGEAKRHRLHDYLREGSCWRTVCGAYDGLLCLMPPETDCLVLALFKDDLARFHAELDTDFVRRLCAAGSILQKSIWDCLELPEFIWESTPTAWLSADEIAPLVAPFRLLKASLYDPHTGASWPKPAGWHGPWPADPAAVLPGTKACEFCTRATCRCVESIVPQVPRISDDGSKGHGIRSVGPHRRYDTLGELVGELVPLGGGGGGGACAADEWTMALRRPDMDDAQVAEIYPWRMGNWVRKVRHSNSHPSAAFKVMKISGRWRQMLVAMRDIQDGEEITAKYGRGFFKKQPYSVVEGLH